jgi:uncharacterized protein (TIGR02996 family)
MRDRKEAAILRTIAENDADNSGRLVLSDLLEEGGDTARAEFVRVQCELAAPKLAQKRRQALRERERALLDAHRHEWIQAIRLPVEDVRFDRGLIAGMRLSKWLKGKLLDEEHAPWLVTLRELDLSGLGLGDSGLRTFAEKATFPALRKVLLNGNEITSAGVSALAAATGLPRLDTVYLFDNSVNAGARDALEKGRRFCVTTVDLGEHDEGYSFSPGQADVARRHFLRTHLLPFVTKTFKTYPHLQSAMLCVAQYWADEANDAVHGELIVSELFQPDLEGARSGYEDDSGPDPNVPNTHLKSKYSEGGSAISFWGKVPWDDNNDAIPLWAAFAPEEGSQEYDRLSEVYAPAVMFYRHGGYEILPMARPHLDGIRPEWEGEE